MAIDSPGLAEGSAPVKFRASFSGFGNEEERAGPERGKVAKLAMLADTRRTDRG